MQLFSNDETAHTGTKKMSRPNSRTLLPASYFEHKESNFDEYMDSFNAARQVSHRPNLRNQPRTSYCETGEPSIEEYFWVDNPCSKKVKRRDLASADPRESNSVSLRQTPDIEKPNIEEYMRVASPCSKEVKRPDFLNEASNFTLRPNLRKKPRISYFEPEEPSFDEYMYCDECSDFVYEYCAIHGPLLVVPDDKVPHKTNFPAYVPRAALTIPHVFLHLAPSIIPGAGLGVFSTLTLPRGVRFGPYCGDRIPQVDSMYCWQIHDCNNKRSHVVDASNGNRSNWMRYVNCARHWKEQNLLAYQYQGQLYYQTIKIIPRFTELMVFYGSEFANLLHINLSKYNKNKYYEEVISASNDFGVKKKISTYYNKQTSEATNDNHEEYMNIDQFVFIDQEQNEKEYNQKKKGLTVETNDIDSNVCINLDTFSMQINNNRDSEILNSSSNDTKTKIFECGICQKTFSRFRNLTRHKRCHIKRNKLYNCQFALCNFRTDSENAFDKHKKYHTKSFKYSCEACFYKTNDKFRLTRHSLIHENNLKGASNDFVVKKERTTYPNESEAVNDTFGIKDDNHEEYTNIDQLVFTDQAQDEKEYNQTNKGLTVETNDNKNSIGTNLDTFSMKVKDNKDSEILNSTSNDTETKRFECGICQKTFTRSKNLTQHKRLHYKGHKLHNCQFPLCNFQTDSEKAFDKHKEYHTKSFKYSCDTCLYKTDVPRHFKAHSLIHENRRSGIILKCDYCSYSTHTRKNFSYHILRQHLKK